MRVSSLHTYPIKGCHRRDHREAAVEPWGLVGDRRFMIVDPDHRVVTQRELAALARIRPELADDRLILRATGHPELTVEVKAGELVEAAVHRDKLPATVTGLDADDWVSAVLGGTYRLLWLDDPTRRPIDETYSVPTDRVSFADGFPLLLANMASLHVVNDWLVEADSPEWPVPMNRFRPNVVVDDAPAWAEDEFVGRRLRIGDVTFRAPKACARCVVTTTDQETGERGREPLRTLGRYRNIGHGLLFAVNLIPDVVAGAPATISVGDPVELL
jgi:MOSC domain-containing protein